MSIEHMAPLGRAYIDRCGGWRCIYSIREINRGKHKGWFEVKYIDLREGKPAFVKGHVPDYKTMEGDLVNGRSNDATPQV